MEVKRINAGKLRAIGYEPRRRCAAGAAQALGVKHQCAEGCNPGRVCGPSAVRYSPGLRDDSRWINSASSQRGTGSPPSSCSISTSTRAVPARP